MAGGELAAADAPPPWDEHVRSLSAIIELATGELRDEQQRDPAASLGVLRVLKAHERATAGRGLPPSEDSRLYRAIVSMSLEPEADWRLKIGRAHV